MAFDALDVAVEIAKALRGPLRNVERRDRDLARQIRRAANGVVLQVSEGRERVGADRLHLFRVAMGSATEVRDALRLAEAWGYSAPAERATARSLIDRERAMLWRLLHPRS